MGKSDIPAGLEPVDRRFESYYTDIEEYALLLIALKVGERTVNPLAWETRCLVRFQDEEQSIFKLLTL